MIPDPSEAKEDEEGGDVGGSIEELILFFSSFGVAIIDINRFSICDIIFTAFSMRRKNDKCDYDICNKEFMIPANSNITNSHPSSAPHQQQSSSLVKSFAARARQFMKDTEQHALQGVNPGGIYQAIWSRDASFILRSWFHSGNIHGVLQQISTIWSHQIVPGKEKIHLRKRLT